MSALHVDFEFSGAGSGVVGGVHLAACAANAAGSRARGVSAARWVFALPLAVLPQSPAPFLAKEPSTRLPHLKYGGLQWQNWSMHWPRPAGSRRARRMAARHAPGPALHAWSSGAAPAQRQHAHCCMVTGRAAALDRDAETRCGPASVTHRSSFYSTGWS